MHITPEWQDVSGGGFRFITIAAADHPQHIGGYRGIEARMRRTSGQPATSDQGEELLVKATPRLIILADIDQRLWLKSLWTQFDAVVTVSAFDTATAGDPVTSYQMRRALGLVGLLDDVYAGLGDMDALPRIQWDSAGVITPGDDLALNIQVTLGYTSDQMAALFASARTFQTKAWG